MSPLPPDLSPEGLAKAPSFFSEARRSFHAALMEQVLRANDGGVPSNADSSNGPSIAIAKGILTRLGAETTGARLAGQMSGSKFEAIVFKFVSQTFPRLPHLPPGHAPLHHIAPLQPPFTHHHRPDSLS